VGIEVVFADVTERWAGHVDLITRLTGLAEDMPWTARAKARLRRATGVEPVTSPQERVAAPSHTLADDARVRAFEVLADRPGAVDIMERQLSLQWGSAGLGPPWAVRHRTLVAAMHQNSRISSRSGWVRWTCVKTAVLDGVWGPM
jgi:hypothetical protein